MSGFGVIDTDPKSEEAFKNQTLPFCLYAIPKWETSKPAIRVVRAIISPSKISDR